MTVFKNYFKIVKRHIGVIIMYAAISIIVSIANTNYNNTEESYISINPSIAIINYDSSKLIDSFIEYIDSKAELIDVNDNEKDIQDALYTNKVDAILIIPKGFTEELFKENEKAIGIKKSLQNTSEYVQVLVNRYFKIANMYIKVGMNEEELINSIEEDIKNEIEVEVSTKQESNLEKLAIFYSFENYAFLSIFMLVIGTIMCIFNKQTIMRRNNVSKMKPKSFSNQIFLGHIVLTLTLWAIFVLVSIIIYKELMFNMNALLLVINSLIFAITATSIAYLIGTLIRNQNVISGIQNVLSLGLSFISGCFVPIEMLDQNIVNFSKIFPSYWFIKNNYDIVEISSFNLETLKPIIQNWIIIIAFGILYFVISKIINSKKAR